MYTRGATSAVLLALLTAACVNSKQEQVRYDGHTVLSVYPDSPHHVSYLAGLQTDADNGLELWSEPSTSREALQMQVPGEELMETMTTLSAMNLRHHVVMRNLQKYLDDHLRQNRAAQESSAKETYSFTHYLSYPQIQSWMSDFVARCPDSVRCELVQLGLSHENRSLTGVKVSGHKSSGRAFWVDGGIHAREWITPVTALYILQQLVSEHTTNSLVRQMLEEWDFYFLPVINVDGFQYSWDVDRMWRKTRSRDDATGCYGVDANRNFGFHWNSVGSSSYPCSSTYAGPSAFSEPETQAVAQYLHKLTNQGVSVDVYITLHSYGQYILLPYGYTTKRPSNYYSLMTVGLAARNAIYRVNGTRYKIDSASRILYSSSGTSRDWAHGAARVPYVYTLELRDTGEWGFLLPPHQILPTARETWAGLKAMASTVSQLKD